MRKWFPSAAEDEETAEIRNLQRKKEGKEKKKKPALTSVKRGRVVDVGGNEGRLGLPAHRVVPHPPDATLEGEAAQGHDWLRRGGGLLGGWATGERGGGLACGIEPVCWPWLYDSGCWCSGCWSAVPRPSPSRASWRRRPRSRARGAGSGRSPFGPAAPGTNQQQVREQT